MKKKQKGVFFMKHHVIFVYYSTVHVTEFCLFLELLNTCYFSLVYLHCNSASLDCC